MNSNYLEAFLNDFYVDYSLRRKIIFQQIMSIILSIVFAGVIGYYLWNVEINDHCYYSSEVNKAFKIDRANLVTSDISWRFHLILLGLLLFHALDGFRSICALLYIFILQRNTFMV